MNQFGWVVDYSEVKTAWESVKVRLDHFCLNDIDGLPNPTCELIAQWIRDSMRLDGMSRIELRETEHCGVVLDC